jgi:predicted secreted Zn-dependent protease
VFYPHKSWTKVKTNHILAHEQGHFDISQLFTRKLYKELKAYKFRPETVDRDVQAIYQRITQEQAAYQNLYDKETNYSRNAAGQESWLQRIEKELTETAAYANYPEQ